MMKMLVKTKVPNVEKVDATDYSIKSQEGIVFKIDGTLQIDAYRIHGSARTHWRLPCLSLRHVRNLLILIEVSPLDSTHFWFYHSCDNYNYLLVIPIEFIKWPQLLYFLICLTVCIWSSCLRRDTFGYYVVDWEPGFHPALHPPWTSACTKLKSRCCWPSPSELKPEGWGITIKPSFFSPNFFLTNLKSRNSLFSYVVTRVLLVRWYDHTKQITTADIPLSLNYFWSVALKKLWFQHEYRVNFCCCTCQCCW